VKKEKYAEDNKGGTNSKDGTDSGGAPFLEKYFAGKLD
jgi:hypothetical protein